MKRGFVVAIGGAAIVIAGLSGCSSDEKKPASDKPATSAEASTSAEATSAPSGSASGSGDTKVVIDGQDQNVSGTVVCTAMGGNMNIAIGEAATAIAVVVSEGDAPTVSSVGLGNVNGVVLAYTSGTGQGDATATKDGKKYTVKGTATGIDMANPLTPVNKPFEIEVGCP